MNGRETWGAKSYREYRSSRSSVPRPSLSPRASKPNTMPVLPIFWGCRLRRRLGRRRWTLVWSVKNTRLSSATAWKLAKGRACW